MGFFESYAFERIYIDYLIPSPHKFMRCYNPCILLTATEVSNEVQGAKRKVQTCSTLMFSTPALMFADSDI